MGLLAQAQDFETLERDLKRQIHYTDTTYYSFDMKIVKDSPNRAVVVVAKFSTPYEEDGFDCKVTVYTVDITTKKILGQYIFPKPFTSDSIKLSTFQLDFAPYQLNAKTRAFGVRWSYNSSSRVSPFGESYIALFVLKNEQPTCILPQLQTSESQGEWDMQCKYDKQEINRLILVAPTQHNGYADLIVKSQTIIRSSRQPKVESDPCVEQELKSPYQKEIWMFKDGKYQKLVTKKSSRK
jgi:hypothetical protein